MKIFHKSILADVLTPVSAFLRISSGSSRAFLLESTEGAEQIGRYSFLGVDPQRTFRGSFAEFRRTFPPIHEPSSPDLPPFTGGAVGAFSYEMVRELENLPLASTNRATPVRSVLMDFYTTVLAFDHVRHQVVILSHQGMEAVEEMEEKLRRADPLAERALWDLPPAFSHPAEDAGSLESNFSQPSFERAVAQAQHLIHAGDIFQVVLSQRFEAEFPDDPFFLYRALRYINPSPYMFFLKMDGTSIIGSSPEMLLKVQGDQLSYRPLAGTRRRGRNPVEEADLESELIRDEKERSEHLMLVDLGRNDLGKVSCYGSVRVEELMFIEKYSHVMHLVSSLRAQLRPDQDRFDALAACFPAGTVTGAPKIRAMEIIDQLEPSQRGLYGGAIGYLDFSGNLDTCIGIRTIFVKDGKAQLQAGAGIVADSIPEREHKECRHKAEALFRAVELGRTLSRRGADA